MKTKRSSNYEIMRDKMELKFAGYAQQEMIDKFSLRHDEAFLYLRFVGREYRINRVSGRAEWFAENTQEYIHADYNDSMTIFDVLCSSKADCRLAQRFVQLGDLPGTAKSMSGTGDLFSSQGKFFAGHAEKLREACEKLGGIPQEIGDVSYIIPVFDFFPVMVQFWDADEEFDAVLKFMWDYNSTDYMHFETIAFATAHIISRLKEVMEDLQ